MLQRKFVRFSKRLSPQTTRARFTGAGLSPSGALSFKNLNVRQPGERGIVSSTSEFRFKGEQVSCLPPEHLSAPFSPQFQNGPLCHSIQSESAVVFRVPQPSLADSQRGGKAPSHALSLIGPDLPIRRDFSVKRLMQSP